MLIYARRSRGGRGGGSHASPLFSWPLLRNATHYEKSMNATQGLITQPPLNHPLRVAARILDEIGRFFRLFYDFELFKSEYNAQVAYDREFPDCDHNADWRHTGRLEAIDNVVEAIDDLRRVTDGRLMKGWAVRILESKLVSFTFLAQEWYLGLKNDFTDCDDNCQIMNLSKSHNEIRADVEDEFARLEDFLGTIPGLLIDDGLASSKEDEERRQRNRLLFPHDGIASQYADDFNGIRAAICGFLSVFLLFERWRIQFNDKRRRASQFPTRWASATFHHKFIAALEATIRAIDALYLAVCPSTLVTASALRNCRSNLLTSYAGYFTQLSADTESYLNRSSRMEPSLSQVREHIDAALGNCRASSQY